MCHHYLKGKLQQGQPHPDGPARLTIGAAFAKWILDDASRKAALAETVTSELGGLALRKSPTEWKQAQGAVGNGQQLLYAQVRTLRQDLADRYGTLVPITSPVFTWLVKHAQFLLNNFAIRSDGLTPFERRWGKRYIHFGILQVW